MIRTVLGPPPGVARRRENPRPVADQGSRSWRSGAAPRERCGVRGQVPVRLSRCVPVAVEGRLRARAARAGGLGRLPRWREGGGVDRPTETPRSGTADRGDPRPLALRGGDGAGSLGASATSPRDDRAQRMGPLPPCNVLGERHHVPAERLRLRGVAGGGGVRSLPEATPIPPPAAHRDAPSRDRRRPYRGRTRCVGGARRAGHPAGRARGRDRRELQAPQGVRTSAAGGGPRRTGADGCAVRAGRRRPTPRADPSPSHGDGHRRLDRVHGVPRRRPQDHEDVRPVRDGVGPRGTAARAARGDGARMSRRGNTRRRRRRGRRRRPERLHRRTAGPRRSGRTALGTHARYPRSANGSPRLRGSARRRSTFATRSGGSSRSTRSWSHDRGCRRRHRSGDPLLPG